ncbi:hypothetical protein Cgig2_011925 [Carnegiea gigantea]|uniref:NB-ARC domain-containing protein n=1 Tax=Carnegiea gigantea TaxID=171969 RepID=A0A9Q1GX72_9CARY|nr:hypothetical protein Cgig2_011925 [Carnegiea gigantea]
MCVEAPLSISQGGFGLPDSFSPPLGTSIRLSKRCAWSLVKPGINGVATWVSQLPAAVLGQVTVAAAYSRLPVHPPRPAPLQRPPRPPLLPRPLHPLPRLLQCEGVAKSILESITCQSYSGSLDLNFLQTELSGGLRDKKFLFNEKYEDWATLQVPFHASVAGSKIIITTRNDEVASAVCTKTPLPLKPLPDDDAWSLFLRHALELRNMKYNPYLECVGRKIVQKCKGLPLAIKTVGGLLRWSRNNKDWEDILQNNMWDLPYDKKTNERARHFSYFAGFHDLITTFQAIQETRFVRTFLQLHATQRFGYLTSEVSTVLKPTLSCLQLRYLDVFRTSINQLPEWVSALCNLQSLILSDHRCLEMLPADMRRLVSPRHLDIRGARLLSQMPKDMSKLKSLQTLTDFIVGKNTGSGIQALRELQQIRGKFTIRQLHNVTVPSDAYAADLSSRKFIDELELEFGSKEDDDSQKAREVVKNLRPPVNVKRLSIRNYAGTTGKTY